MRAGIFIRSLDSAEPRQAIISGDAVAALVKRLEIVVKRYTPAIMPGLTVLEERLEALVLQVIAHQAGLR